MVFKEPDNNEGFCGLRSGAGTCTFEGSRKENYFDISEVCYP